MKKLLKLGLLAIVILALPASASAPKEEIAYNRLFLDGTGQSSYLSQTLAYGASRLLQSSIMCESNGRHDGIWGNENEYGIAQFKKSTFYWMAGLANKNDLRWKDRADQLWLLSWA